MCLKQSGSFFFLKEGLGKKLISAGRNDEEIFPVGKGLGRFNVDQELTRKFQTTSGSVQEDLTFMWKAAGRKISSWELTRKTHKKTRKELEDSGKTRKAVKKPHF